MYVSVKTVITAVRLLDSGLSAPLRRPYESERQGGISNELNGRGAQVYISDSLKKLQSQALMYLNLMDELKGVQVKKRVGPNSTTYFSQFICALSPSIKFAVLVWLEV